MLRWLLLIPFALLVAMGAGVFAMMVASVASAEIALLIGGGFERLLDALFGLAESGVDPGPAAAAAFSLIGRLGSQSSSRRWCWSRFSANCFVCAAA